MIKKGGAIMAFEDSKKKVELMDALQDLRSSLKALGSIPNDMRIYDYAIHFFNIIATFNDKYSVSKNTFKRESEKATLLAKHLGNAGRCSYGWVRSKKGEEVTLDNLYLGNVYGIWTKPARVFKDMPNDKYVQHAIQGQLYGFIESHRKPMIDLIDNILNNEEKPNGLMFRIFGKMSKSSTK